MQFGFFIQKQKHPEDPIFQELQTNFSLIEGAIKRAAILGRGLIDAINSSSQLSYDQQKELRKLVEKLENSLKPQDCHLRFDGMIV